MANQNGFLGIGLLVKKKKSKIILRMRRLLERLQVDNNQNSKACCVRYLQGRVF
jgi:hypothetical protein